MVAWQQTRRSSIYVSWRGSGKSLWHDGPVYAVYNEKPMTIALNEARRRLAIPSGINAMIAGAVDVVPTELTGKKERISAEFVFVDRNSGG